MGIVFIFGLSVGAYKIFPYDTLNSSLDAIKEETSSGDNQFIVQSDLDSLVKINDELDIDQKRNDLIEFFWDVGSFYRVTYNTQLPEVESDISDSKADDESRISAESIITEIIEAGGK